MLVTMAPLFFGEKTAVGLPCTAVRKLDDAPYLRLKAFPNPIEKFLQATIVRRLFDAGTRLMNIPEVLEISFN